MPIPRFVREIAGKGVTVTLADIPIGRQPQPVVHQVHEAFDRAILKQFLNRLLAWFNTFSAQNYENPDIIQMNNLRRELCARINMLDKYQDDTE